MDLAPKFSHLSILSTFYMWHEVRVQLHFCFACGYLFVPSSFVEDPVCFFPPLKSLSSLAKYYLTINIVYFWTLTFTPFCISIFMPVLHYLDYCNFSSLFSFFLKSGNVSPPTCSSFFKIVLPILGPFNFHMNIRVSLSVALKRQLGFW